MISNFIVFLCVFGIFISFKKSKIYCKTCGRCSKFWFCSLNLKYVKSNESCLHWIDRGI